MPRASLLLAVAAPCALLLAAPPARGCTISTTGVAFGVYNPRGSAADDGTGSIDLSCHPSVHAPEVELGTGSSGSYASRSMADGASKLNYNLYTNSARTIVWGDGSGGTSAVTLPEGSVSQGQRRFSGTVYGRIPALQNVPAGSYADTLVVTVTF